MPPSGRGKGKGKYMHRGGKRPGPPRGGDGQGDFLAGPMSKYRTQPLPEMLSAPGIVVSTVQGKERTAEREIFEALEEAADELYPETKEVEDNGSEGDIEDMLKKELAALSGATPGSKSSRFRMTKRDSACVVYVVVLEPLDPVKLVNHIMEKCERTARCGYRFVQRLTPIAKTGPANKTTLEDMSTALLPDAFQTEDGRGLKFAINAHTRNSDKLGRLEMIKIVAEEVPKLNSAHSVDLKSPERTIMIELFRNVVGMSVVQDFEKYKKFNPSAVAKDAAKAAGIEIEEDHKPKEDEVDEDKPRLSEGQAKTANRERRAAGIAEAQAKKDEKAATPAVPAKRKAELEDGQVAKVDDVERGEVVEDESAELGDDFQEVIEGGRATKVRREE